MDLEEYSDHVFELRNKELSDRDLLACSAMGLAGEAGEYADFIKKVLYQGHAMNKDKVLKELGDVVYYWALAVRTNGLTPEQVLAENIAKLNVRYPNGFTVEDSVNRKKEEE